MKTAVLILLVLKSIFAMTHAVAAQSTQSHAAIKIISKQAEEDIDSDYQEYTAAAPQEAKCLIFTGKVAEIVQQSASTEEAFNKLADENQILLTTNIEECP